MSDNLAFSRISQQNAIRVLDVRIYRGPHLYSATPMVRIQIDSGTLEQLPTNHRPDFAGALLNTLPGLALHDGSFGTEADLLQRMTVGQWLGHVIELTALELQAMVGHPVMQGEILSTKYQPDRYNVMYAYKDEQTGLLAGRIALELVNSLLPLELRGLSQVDTIAVATGPYCLAARLEELRAVAGENIFGPTTASLVREAERRGIPVTRMDDSSLVLMGHGRHQRRIRASCSDLTSVIATEIASDKDLTKLLLGKAGLPVPQGKLVRAAEDACDAARQIGYPVVVKPLDGNHGRGVNVGLASDEDLRWAFEQAREHSRTVIVEQQLVGSDHRILVIGGNVVAVAERIPAHVIGDGQHSIAELVAITNLDPRRGEGHSSVLTWIEIDECVMHFLAKSRLSPASIPQKGSMVLLRPTANLSTGGTARDRTDVIHPENAMIARRAAKIVGLDIAGVDFCCPDISRPVSETGGGIIEVNAGPGFRMHLQPSEGRPRNVAEPVLDLLFPDSANGRIPIFAVAGTNGKSTTCRMLSHILQQHGLHVGLTSSTGIYLDNARIVSGDCSGSKSARIVLAEPDVDAAVLECPSADILLEGLVFDACDIGAVLNIYEDHHRLNGIETVEDLAAVKSVVVESVRQGGWSILNADDPQTVSMATHATSNVCYFSLLVRSDWPAVLRDHIAQGGRAVTRQTAAEGWEIHIHDAGETLFVMEVATIPATLQGLARFNVANALAAYAMAFCHGIPTETIRTAMMTFTTVFDQLPPRQQLYQCAQDHELLQHRRAS